MSVLPAGQSLLRFIPDLDDLASGEEPELLDFDPRWFGTSILPFGYDDEAKCPNFKQFLYQVLERNPSNGHALHPGDKRLWVLQEWFGYTLLCDGRFQKFEGSERELPADFVFLAMGFVGPEKGTWLELLGVSFDERGNVVRDGRYMTAVPGVFVAGDMGRGQSLIVWAIAEGRSCAAGVDAWLMGETQLPTPIAPSARPLA